MPASIEALVTRVTGIQALCGAVGVVAMLVHITAYVVSRHVMGSPIPATVELVSYYYMVLIAFLPLAWAERRGDMIVVEVFGQFFRGAFRTINAAFVAILTAGAYVALTYTTWLLAMREFHAGSFVISLNVPIPVWPSYFILPVSFGLAALVAILKAGFLVAGRAATAPARAAEEGFRE